MFKKLLIFACVCASAYAGASPTSLFLMPIADIVKHLEGFADAGLQGTEHNVSRGYTYFNAGCVGVLNRGEIGFANDFMGHTTYDAKLQLFEGSTKTPLTALSAGIINCTGNHREPYVVGRCDFKDFRLHGGYWNTQGCGRMMLGMDFKVLKEGSGSLEYLSGPQSQTWASLYYPIDQIPGLGIFLSVGFPSDRSQGIQHAATLIYSFKL